MDLARPALTFGAASATERRTDRPFLVAAVVAGVVAITAYFTWESFVYMPPEMDASITLPGEFHPSQGNLHLQNGRSFSEYSTNPPTSGPHWVGGAAFLTAKGHVVGIPPAWGVYDEELPNEALVHAEEHGGVIVWFDAAAGCRTDCQQSLTDVVSRFVDRGRHVILVPRHNLGSPIVLTAWTRLQRLNHADMVAIAAFVTAHDRRYNPEGLP
jgi:hypothetical protein